MLKYILTLIAISGVFTLDVYLPGIPDASKSLGSSISEINFTFILFSIIFSCGQLFWGPLSDRFGRRPILILGLALATTATVLCAFTQHYWQLLCLRAIQAVGVSCFVVLNAIIRDLYDGSIATRWRAYLAIVSGVSISIAPSIGAIFVDFLGWRGTFLASSLVLLIALLSTKHFFTETYVPTYHNRKKILSNYLLLIKEKTDFMAHAIQSALAYSIHFCFIILSAYIVMEVVGLNLTQYSVVMFIYGLSWLASGTITTFLSTYLTNSGIVKVGCSITLLGAVVLFFLSIYCHSLNIYMLMLPVLIMVLGAIIVRPTSITMALSSVPEISGQGSAMINLLQFSLSSIAASMISYYNNYAIILIASYAIFCVLSITTLQFFLKRTKEAISENNEQHPIK